MSTDPESMFPAKAGGMVDTARKQAEAEAAQLAAIGDGHQGAEPGYDAIKVTEAGADLARGRTFSVATGAANPIVELLGADENRRYAVIWTLDEPVVLSFSQQSADDPRNAVNAAGLSANGVVLPVNMPVPFSYTGVIWCTALSATATRVSVMAFSCTGPP